MMDGGTIGLILIGVVIALGIYFGHQEDKQREKEQQDFRRQQREEFEAEKLKPKYFIEFIDLDGKVRKTKKFEPYLMPFWGGLSELITSKQRAEKVMDRSYKDAHFEDESGETIPTSRIKRAYFCTIQEDHNVNTNSN